MLCPHCGVEIETDDLLPGEKVACPECFGQFDIPGKSPRTVGSARSAAARATDVWLVVLVLTLGAAIYTSPAEAEFATAVWRVIWWAAIPTGLYLVALLVCLVTAAER